LILHPNLEGWEKIGYQKGMCPIAEDIHKESRETSPYFLDKRAVVL
jgi:hypothetical protein